LVQSLELFYWGGYEGKDAEDLHCGILLQHESLEKCTDVAHIAKMCIGQVGLDTCKLAWASIFIDVLWFGGPLTFLLNIFQVIQAEDIPPVV